jgi:PAS domain S-box-containing protein
LSGVAIAAPGQLASAAGLLSTLLEISTEAVVLVDGARNLTDWNQSAERMFGTPRDRAFGGAFEHLFAPERHNEVRELLRKTSMEQSSRTTTVARRFDGSRLIVEVACSALHAGRGDASAYLVLLRDITEPMVVRSAASAVAFEPDASAALESFVQVLGQVVPIDNLTLTAMEGDAARRVASAGRCARRLRSGEIVPLEGTPLGEAVSGRKPVVCLDTRDGELPYDEVLANAGIHSYVVLPLFHAGRVVATFNVGFSTADAPTAGVVDLLGSLTASIMPIVLNLVTLEEQAGAIQRLEQLDALKNEFLALITHDIRTPLSVIAGFAESLHSRWTELPEDEKLESVDAILRNGRNVARLVEEGLQVARIESGVFGYELRPVALGREVERVIADLSGEGAQRIQLSVEPDLPSVLCDPDRHWQIFMNLLSNALKFSAPETTIDVSVTHRGSAVQVAVRDRGPGIKRSDLPKLFHKFSRVGGPEQLGVRGTGLGLYITKAMVEGQGGQIWVHSAPRRGSTFVYTLPIAQPEVAERC